MLPIDADSHFLESLDLFEKRIDARFRGRAYLEIGRLGTIAIEKVPDAC